MRTKKTVEEEFEAENETEKKNRPQTSARNLALGWETRACGMSTLPFTRILDEHQRRRRSLPFGSNKIFFNLFLLFFHLDSRWLV